MDSECRAKFEELHALFRNRRFKVMERRLINDKTGRIKAPFSCDLNHAWYLVGDSLFKRRRWKEAVSAFRKSYSHDRSDWQALMALGNCFDELHLPAKAAFAFRRALSINPRSNDLKYNLANALFDMGRFDDAIVQYKGAKRASGNLGKLARRNEELAKRSRSKDARV